LTFETEEIQSKEMSASTTPIDEKYCSTNVIDIIDSDDEPDVSHKCFAR